MLRFTQHDKILLCREAKSQTDPLSGDGRLIAWKLPGFGQEPTPSYRGSGKAHTQLPGFGQEPTPCATQRARMV